MEPRFGYDFSQIRVHTDSQAAHSAKDIRALAYTVRQNVVFAEGQYAPLTRRGRALLAHELTHIIQQSAHSVQKIQRQPAPQPTAQQKATPAAKTTSDIDLAMAHFGDADKLNAAFQKLSPKVISAVGETTADRAQFLGRMSLYFKSLPDVLDHFSKIEEVGIMRDPLFQEPMVDPVSKKPIKKPGFKNVKIFLHHDARLRFERAAQVLLSKGRRLPDVNVGFALRGLHKEKKITHKGKMVHATGIAIDIAAFSNPAVYKDTMVREMIKTVVEDKYRLHLKTLDKVNIDQVIIEMGKGTASPDTEKKFFEMFEKEFKKMESASQAFTQSLSPSKRDEVLRTREEYFDVLDELEKEREKKKADPKVIKKLEQKLEKEREKKKADPKVIKKLEQKLEKEREKKPADPKVIKELEQKRVDKLKVLPGLMTEWIDAIKARIAREHPGMEKVRSPSQISRALKKKQLEVERVQLELSAAKQDFRRHAKGKPAPTTAPPSEPFPIPASFADWEPGSYQAAQEHLVLSPLEKALEKALSDAESASISAKVELENANKFSSKDWAEVDILLELKDALEAPDLDSRGGVERFERLTTGDLPERKMRGPPNNPPLLRVLQIGYINPKEAFDIDFFKEMARSGFKPGAAWESPTDSMHFELQEGREKLKDPSNPPKTKNP